MDYTILFQGIPNLSYMKKIDLLQTVILYYPTKGLLLDTESNVETTRYTLSSINSIIYSNNSLPRIKRR